ncbi:alpha/beta hydrolase [Oxynema aestuarii]|uniref:Alpha/beta fold hydrolase n=1 Tax=Oxynema aestuarii AP17 TaxID=2064643 RepID=A0A6H1U371_9CYAN|nr:alpha/beta fold hydrolase [Oxynema aestuarii]QIZ73284.1 alpha/beta fold hydrolase [Oxynema aestuarii AP17]
MHLQRLSVFFSIFLLTLGLVGSFVLNPIAEIDSEALSISRDSQGQLIGRLYVPKNTPPPYPVAVLMHGVNAYKQMMAPLGVELARGGMAAIALDFGGSGESYRIEEEKVEETEDRQLADARAVVDYLRDRGDRFDRDRIAVVGHSLGGRIALKLGKYDPEIAATVVLGMGGEATPKMPKNLFLGVGLYEQLNPPSEAIALLQQAAPQNYAVCINSERICGNFEQGTARALEISPSTDHIGEPFDPYLIRGVTQWLQQAFGVSQPLGFPKAPPLIVCFLAIFSGGVALGTHLFWRTGLPVRLPEIREIYRYCVSWLLGLVMALQWGLALLEVAPRSGAGNMVGFGYMLLLTSNYAIARNRAIARCFGVPLLYLGLLAIAFIAPALMNGLPQAFANPDYLLALPLFLIQWPLFWLYNGLLKVKLLFFPIYSFGLQPSWLLVLLVTIELLWPGITLTKFEKCASWAIALMRRPLTFTGMGRWNRRQGAIVLGLSVVLMLAVYWRLSDGLLAIAAGQLYVTVYLVGQMLFLPLSILAIAVRSRPFQAMEGRIVALTTDTQTSGQTGGEG